MKARFTGLIMLAFLVAALLAVASSYPSVSAQSCTASLGYSSLTTSQYTYGSNIGIVTPVSAYCSFTGGQLYATGDAFDTIANIDYGSVSTTLNPAYQASSFNGQLVFSLPSAILGHQVRLTVSVLQAQNGPLLATAQQMVQVNLNYQNGYPYGCNGAYNCNYNNGYNCNGYNCSGYCYGSWSSCYPTYSSPCTYYNGYSQPSSCYIHDYGDCYYYRTYYYYGGTYYYYYNSTPYCDYNRGP